MKLIDQEERGGGVSEGETNLLSRLGYIKAQ